MSYEVSRRHGKSVLRKMPNRARGNVGRKRKSALEADELEGDEPVADEEELEPEPAIARTAKEVKKGKGKRSRKHCIRGGRARGRVEGGAGSSTNDRSTSAIDCTSGTYVLKCRSQRTGSLEEE